MPRKEQRRQPRFRPLISEAAILQQRIAAGEATPDEARHYQRIIAEFRRKFANGQLSPQSARQFGIE
jgi:hypothetical protein